MMTINDQFIRYSWKFKFFTFALSFIRLAMDMTENNVQLSMLSIGFKTIERYFSLISLEIAVLCNVR